MPSNCYNETKRQRSSNDQQSPVLSDTDFIYINEQEAIIMATAVITKENFQSEVLDTQGTVLIDFWADWCGPCRMLSPIVDEVAEIGRAHV